jgi:hypothetical protein
MAQCFEKIVEISTVLLYGIVSEVQFSSSKNLILGRRRHHSIVAARRRQQRRDTRAMGMIC